MGEGQDAASNPADDPVARVVSASASALLDAAGMLAQDIACRRCGYNLRGLRLETCCPECAAPVATSAQGDILCLSDPAWRARVANGVRWMLWGGAGALVASLMNFVPVYIRGAHLPTLLLSVIMLVAGYYGVWLCTTPEPDRFERHAAVRVWTRSTVVAWLSLRIVGWRLQTVPFGEFAGNYCSAVVGTAADIGALVMVVRLVARIPNERLARRLVCFTWCYALGMAVVLAFGLVARLCYLLGASSPAAMAFLDNVVIVIIVPLLVLLAARLVALFFVSKALGGVTTPGEQQGEDN